MADTIPGFLKTLTEWVVSVSQWFDGWDITLLVPALIILTVIAGVTGRAAVGPRLWMQLVWGTVTVILGLIEVAIIWTIIARYLPVADMGTLIPEHATTQAAARYRVSRGTVPLDKTVGLEKLGVKVPTLTLTME